MLMRILVVNAGSSSLKSQLIETDGKVSLMKCLAEKVGTPDAYMNVAFAPDFQKVTYHVADMTVAECLKKLLEALVDDPESPISDLSQIDAIGNRIVAGGEYFTKSVIIDGPAREKLELCEELAPLHNPPADACIDMMAALMPSTPQVAVFDTAFHATMPAKAYMYPLPARYYDDYRIRRYGAHGTSHRYAAQQAANLLGRPLRDLGLITCHLGNGGSITAVNHGKSIDTTMGFTPLEGLLMGTRAGSFDPAVVLYLGKVLPPAMMGLLTVYCFKNVTWLSGAHGAPELLASAAVVGLHLWKRNVLFSIAGGTALYMVLVQAVFA